MTDFVEWSFSHDDKLMVFKLDQILFSYLKVPNKKGVVEWKHMRKAVFLPFNQSNTHFTH